MRYNGHADKMKIYKGFQVGELVMVHLSKDFYPKGKFNMLNVKKIGPHQIKRSLRYNSFEVKLLEEMNILHIFHMKDLFDFAGFNLDEVADEDKENEEPY
jgi:hypothetical protein